jgi:pSer/pThr/pTyr-binding forkhead associated (FHA) protein
MKVVIEDEAGTRTVVPFTSDELVLGRAAEGVAWRLPDRNVSRRHCRFARANGAVFVEDLGSLTGTWLNGERISGRRRVRAGDLVEVGDYDLVVLADQAEAAGPGTPPPLRAAGTARPEPPLATPAVVAPADPAGRAEARRQRLRKAALAGGIALVGGLAAGLLLGRLRR